MARRNGARRQSCFDFDEPTPPSGIVPALTGHFVPNHRRAARLRRTLRNEGDGFASGPAGDRPGTPWRAGQSTAHSKGTPVSHDYHESRLRSTR